MDHGVEVSVKPQRRRKSVADVQSILNRSRQQGSAGGTALHAIIEEAPPLRTPLSLATDANGQMTNMTRATEIPKKPHRRSSTAGISVEGSEKEKKPLSQVRSFMEVKRSEEAHILKALRLEDMVGSLQSDLSRVQREALEANAQVSELKAKLAESEQSRETLSSRSTETIRELAEARYEVKELKAKLDKVTQEYTAARNECEISAAAAKEASERSKAVIEALQRRVHLPGTDVGLGTKEGLVQELETLQKKVHEQDEFASSLNELHVQVEKTRLEIKARLDEASEKASAMGLGKHMDDTFGKGISASLPAIETENSSIACNSPHVKMGDEDRCSADFCGSQESPSRQESELLALSTRSSSLGFQPENSNENTAEKVSALTISEAAKPLVGVKSQIEMLCPVGVPPGNPAFHGCDANDAGLGCTQAPSWRSEAQGTESLTAGQLDH